MFDDFHFIRNSRIFKMWIMVRMRLFGAGAAVPCNANDGLRGRRWRDSVGGNVVVVAPGFLTFRGGDAVGMIFIFFKPFVDFQLFDALLAGGR